MKPLTTPISSIARIPGHQPGVDLEPRADSLTTLDELRRQIAVLACVDETGAPFVSCYLDLKQGEDSYRKALEDSALAMRSTLEGNAKADFDAAIDQINDYMSGILRPEAKRVALFSRHYRGGAFFLPMQFAAPVPNWIAVYPSPNLFHLMA